MKHIPLYKCSFVQNFSQNAQFFLVVSVALSMVIISLFSKDIHIMYNDISLSIFEEYS